MTFVGKVVLITGASSGIGADAACHLAKMGANVSMVGRNEERLNKVGEQILLAGASTPLLIVADVRSDANRIVDKTIEHFGKIDVLVNAAGVMRMDELNGFKMVEFDKVFDTNLRSIVNLTQLCIPHLEKSKGNIVNVSSAVGIKPIENTLSYSMSKAALDKFTTFAALTLAGKGIRVNAINPASVKTPIYEKIGMAAKDTEETFNKVAHKYPVKRVGNVSDTSGAIAYLANNDLCSFLTGVLLPVDGGAIVATGPIIANGSVIAGA